MAGDTKERIMETALKLFAEKGSLAEIVAAYQKNAD